jgi:hypothetical protein
VQSTNLTAGEWERVDPVGTQTGGTQAQPEDDAGEGDDRFCYITEQHTGGGVGSSDVDGGPTVLTSPVIDLSGGDAIVSYDRWHFSTPVGDGDIDELITEVSNNGSVWVNVDATSGSESEWQHHAFRVGAYVTPSANVQVRFSVTDNPNDSYTESGIDNFTVDQLSCVDDAGPEVVHGLAGTSFDDHSFGGYIDPRRETSDGVSVNQGIDEVVIGFNEPVVAVGGGPITAASFSVNETGGGAAPSITGVDVLDDQTVRVSFDRIITLQEWTTVIASVEDLNGNVMVNGGDQGPGVDETDRVDIGFLPTNVDQNTTVTPFDLLTFRQYVNGSSSPAQGVVADFADIDRNGATTPFDLLALRQLINGTGPVLQPWNGESMNNPRP